MISPQDSSETTEVQIFYWLQFREHMLPWFREHMLPFVLSWKYFVALVFIVFFFKVFWWELLTFPFFFPQDVILMLSGQFAGVIIFAFVLYFWNELQFENSFEGWSWPTPDDGHREHIPWTDFLIHSASIYCSPTVCQIQGEACKRSRTRPSRSSQSSRGAGCDWFGVVNTVMSTHTHTKPYSCCRAWFTERGLFIRAYKVGFNRRTRCVVVPYHE